MKLFCNLDKKTIIINDKQEKLIKEMIAYHGSKANFDEFNIAYMGSGIGAQEFGEGLYLTFDKENACGYGGNVYTVDIPNADDGNYIYYNEPIPSEVFDNVINNIIEDRKLQYPDEYQDEESVNELREELYEVLNPSEGRYLMYNIHRYVDDPIVCANLLKRSGLTGFIYNNGKVNNVIMFSSKDIKILDKEVISESLCKKDYINETIDKINQIITEEYGINDEILALVNPLGHLIRQKIQNDCKQEVIQKGLIHRQKSFSIKSTNKLFDNLTKIINKFKNFSLNVIVNNYNFKNNNYYNDYIKVNGEDIDSALGFTSSISYATGILFFNYISIGGKPLKSFYSDLQHELSHYFQQLQIDSKYENSEHIVNINTSLNSNDETIKRIAQTLYYCDNAEQDSVVNGLYGFIVNDVNKELFDIVKIDDEIKNDTSLKWLYKLEENYKWLETLKKDEIEPLLKSQFNVRSLNFLKKYVQRQKQRLAEKISKCVLKIKKDLGLINGYGLKTESIVGRLTKENFNEYFTSIELLNEALLLEANLDDIYTKYYSNIPQDIFWQIIQSDPTYNSQKQQKMGKYGKWLLNLFRQNKLKTEDLYKATDYLSYFVKYYNRIEQKDINQIPDLPSLFNIIQPFKEAADNGEELATSNSDEVRKIKQDAEKFYEDDTWLVIIPHSQEVSCYYGKNTQWCTAATDSYNMFNQYYSKGLLYININKKTNKKYQFHFETNSFMDETDAPIHCPINKTIGINDNLLQSYISKYGGKATILLTQVIDLDDCKIEGKYPYYVYNDYDGYEHIVEVNGTNIKPCKGIDIEEMTDENNIRYIGNGIFMFNNSELVEYYDEETDEYYDEGEYEVSDDYTLYDAKTGKRINLSEDASSIYKLNDSYIHYSENNKNILLSVYDFSKVLETDQLTQSTDYFIKSYRFRRHDDKYVNYDDDIIILVNYSRTGSQYNVYNLYTQQYIIPPFEGYYVTVNDMEDGYRYILFRELNSEDSKYCLLLSDGSLSQVYKK